MVPVEHMLRLCEETYSAASIVAGPDQRDGARVVSYGSGIVALCFRGTLANHDFPSLLSWLNDFNARLTRTADFEGRVHAGFLVSLVGLLPEILPALKSAGLDVSPIAPPPPKPEPWYRRLINHFAGPPIFEADTPVSPTKKPFLILGHSLGGALAILAGEMFKHLSPTVVTFAAPMCGDLDFSAGYSADVKVTRYEAADDVVPWLPPFGYESVGHLIAERDFIVFSRDPLQREKYRRKFYHGLLMDLLDPLKAKDAWARAMQGHHLTTYRAWLCKDDPPNTPTAEAA